METIIAMQQEIGLVLILVLMLLMKLREQEGSSSMNGLWVSALLIINSLLGIYFFRESVLFSGMYQQTKLMFVEKTILSFGTLLIIMQAQPWLKSHKHVPEFYMLLVTSLMGMFFMISSGNMLMFYLGLELSTIPLAALANFDLAKQKSSESAMKMILSSAFSSGILLFGMSMLYGSSGTLSFEDMASHLRFTELQVFAFILIFAGFGFKLSVVPFHLWTADVYEGAPVAVTAFLSVISKGAMVFAFIPFLYKVFGGFIQFWYEMLFVASVITMTVGNLFAIRQNNMKRFLAFSSITQAGYILLGISGASQAGTASSVFFILTYIVSNLGAFGVVALVSAASGKENISDYKGLYKTNPVLSVILALSLFSLAGIPPTAGFFGKLFLFYAGAAHGNYLFITVAGLNMIISLYYYLKVVTAMFVEESEAPVEKISVGMASMISLIVCVIGMIALGFVSQVFEHIFLLSKGI